MCVGDFGDQKLSELPGLELRMVVRYHVGAGKQTSVFCKSSQSS